MSGDLELEEAKLLKGGEDDVEHPPHSVSDRPRMLVLGTLFHIFSDLSYSLRLS